MLRHLTRTLPQIVAVLGVLSCADQPPVAPRYGVPGRAHLAMAPAFQPAPPGAPTVDLSKVRGVLIGVSGDSTIVEATFDGDTAVLAFEVQFPGASANYLLDLTAFDTHGVVAYHASQNITLKPGDNPTIPPLQLVYSAPDAALTTLHVAPAALTLNAGTSGGLGVSGSDAHGQPISSIRAGWTSRDPSVATVDDAGAVHAGQFQGETYIVARTMLNVADSALVKVHAPVDHIVVAPASLQIVRGLSGAVGAELRDAGDHLIDDRTATWSSSDPSVATVSASGAIEALKIGTTTITATAEGKTASAAVTVVTPIDHIELTPSTLTFASLEETQSIAAHVVPKTGASVDGIVPVLSSANAGVASVDASGSVTSHANGSTSITATADGVTASAGVTVKQVPVSVVISPKTARVTYLGATFAFTGTANDALGSPLADGQLTFSSSAPSIASVGADGVAVGHANGTVTITASANGKSDAAQFTVAQAPGMIIGQTDRTQIQVGQSAQLSVQVADEGGNVMSTTNATWTAMTPTIASVTPSGQVVGLAPGTARFSGTALRFTTTIMITVTAVPVTGGSATGQVVSGTDGTPIAGATITGGSGATSGSDGSFTVTGLSTGGTLSIAAPGFVSTQYFGAQTGAAGTTTQLGSVPLAPTSTLNGSVNGQVIDATTGYGVPSATITFRSGIGAKIGSAVGTTTTDGSGNYSIQLAAGTYTASATASEFAAGSATAVSLGGQTNANQNVSLVPGTGLRITLTWGAQPRDLDSHLFGPTASGGTFHTWYADPNDPDGQSLDHDVTSGFGPENTTVPSPIAGTYRFYVQHYSGTSSMAASPTMVTVTLNGTVIGTFHPPTRTNEQPGDIWEVFTLNGTTITPLNTIVSGIQGEVSSVRAKQRSGTSRATQDIDAIRASAQQPKKVP